MFIDHLANGVDPVTNSDVDTNTLHNEQIISCFRYISDIMSAVIYESETKSRKYKDFYITDDQYAELKTFSYPCKVSELAGEINRVTEVNGTRKLPAKWINDWLESEGYLCQSELKSRIATDKGKTQGISSEYRQTADANRYYINLFAIQAQKFIFAHVNDIIAFSNEKKSQEKRLQDDFKVQDIDYPQNLTVKEFIRQNHEKCFIMAIGSCDSVAGIGSYIAVLHYKGKSKVLKKKDIPTSSANKCILTGILDAAASIKSPTDVMILSSTPLGFHSPHSKNYSFLLEIYRILTDKGCNLYISVCKGKGYELSSFVKSIQ